MNKEYDTINTANFFKGPVQLITNEFTLTQGVTKN